MKKPMKIIIIVVASIAVLAVGGILFLLMSYPKPADYAYLEEPRIVEKKEVNSLQVRFDGDPDTVLQEAYGSLYATYYKLEGVPKGFGQSPSIARYEDFDNLLINVTTESLKELDWRGFVALPLPETITSIPPSENPDYPVELARLSYGTVAEIVHFGPYKDEAPVIDKLKRYIADQGYEIAGLHEEEYIKGPGMFFVGEKDYITVIRYQVRPKQNRD